MAQELARARFSDSGLMRAGARVDEIGKGYSVPDHGGQMPVGFASGRYPLKVAESGEWYGFAIPPPLVRLSRARPGLPPQPK